jgi:hypothetical protein
VPFDAADKFTPTPWTPLTAPYTLFNVAPPTGDPRDPDAAADLEWYRLLRRVTARAVMLLATEVDRNYSEYRGVKLSGRGLGGLIELQRTIAFDYFDDDALRPHHVGDVLNRLVKTFGLVVHDQTPGPRHGWPMASHRVDYDEALEVVEQAFQGKWPDPPAGAALATTAPPTD